MASTEVDLGSNPSQRNDQLSDTVSSRDADGVGDGEDGDEGNGGSEEDDSESVSESDSETVSSADGYDSEESEDEDYVQLKKQKKSRDSKGSSRNNTGKNKSAKKRSSSSSKRSRRKDKASKKRRGVNAFLDVEAQVGDEEEEEGDEDVDFEEAREAQRIASQAHATRRKAAEDWGRRGGAAHLESAIDSLQRRYQYQSFEEGEEEDDFLDDAEALEYEESTEANLLPDMNDPKLWLVKLYKSGTEREAAISILHKSFSMQAQGKDLNIYSCYASDDLKGYIYVEAENQYSVKEALRDFRLMKTTGEIKMVPLKEMPSIFTHLRTQQQHIPQRGEFVRVRRGVYANDIGQVLQVDEQGLFVSLRLIPRIDVKDMLDREKGLATKGASLRSGKGKRLSRSEKRFFDREHVDSSGGQVEQGLTPGTVRFGGCTFEEAGYIVRRVAVRHLLCGSAASPTLSELKEFTQPMNDAEKEEWLGSRRPLISLLKQQRSTFRLGERVVVISGELKGLKGKVGEGRGGAEGEEEQVEIIFEQTEYGSVLLKANELQKDFREGESVRALHGMNAGHSGLITNIDRQKQVASVFSPTSNIEFKCALDSLTHAPQNGLHEDGLLTIGGYGVHDFVEVTTGEKGVLTFIDKNRTNIRVLLPSNQLWLGSVPQLSCKICTDMSTCLDTRGSVIDKNAHVVILCPACRNSSCSCTLTPSAAASVNSAAEQAGREGVGGFATVKGEQGRVLHVWRSTAFVKVPGRADTAGVVAVEGSNLDVCGGSSIRPGSRTGGIGRMGSIGDDFAFRNRRGGARRFGMRRPDELQGKIVKINKGKYKGKLATIREVERDEIQVLLHVADVVTKLSKADVQIMETSREYPRGLGYSRSSSSVSLRGCGSYPVCANGLDIGSDGTARSALTTPGYSRVGSDYDASTVESATRAAAAPGSVSTWCSDSVQSLPGGQVSRPLTPVAHPSVLLPLSFSGSRFGRQQRSNSFQSTSESGFGSELDGLVEEDTMPISELCRRSREGYTATAGSRVGTSPDFCVEGVIVDVDGGEHAGKRGMIRSVDVENRAATLCCGSDVISVAFEDLKPFVRSSVNQKE